MDLIQSVVEDPNDLEAQWDQSDSPADETPAAQSETGEPTDESETPLDQDETGAASEGTGSESPKRPNTVLDEATGISYVFLDDEVTVASPKRRRLSEASETPEDLPIPEDLPTTENPPDSENLPAPEEKVFLKFFINLIFYKLINPRDFLIFGI